MMSYKRMMPLALAVLWALPMTVAAQDDPAKVAQNKLLSKRAAEADAYRRLAETVKGVRITSDTHVRDFVTESDTITAEFDGFIRGVRLGKPRWDIDLTCTVEAEVTVAKVIETLKSIHQRHYKGNTLTARDFEEIKRTVQKDVFKAVGMGAPRPDLPPDVPGGDIPMPDQIASPPPPAIPALWRQIPPQERLMAKRAAEVDAMRRLVERIKGLRLTSDTLVRDFVAESDQITAEARGTLTGAYEVGNPYYHTDDLIVEVTYEVPVESVITTIKTLHKRHYKGDRVTAMDIEKITQTLKTQKFQAVGMGVPRPQAFAVVEQKTEMEFPDWVGKTIAAEGQGVPPSDKAGSPQGKLMAARAAELDAKRRLAEQVMGFQIDSSTSVRDFVTEHDEISTQLDSYITGSYVRSTNYDADGTATVVVEMPAAQIWDVIHIYIKRQTM